LDTALNKNLFLEIMHMRYSFFLLLLSTCRIHSFGQSTIPTNTGLPPVAQLPASPNATAMSTYGDIPVHFNTGLPSISIPIYELKECGVTLPISLSYHAGGVRVQEDAGIVGTGWNLNVGGVITRVVRGQPDEAFQGFFSTRASVKRMLANDMPADSLKIYRVRVMKGEFDSEPDLFICTVGNLSIKYSMDLDGQFVTFPNSNYKISWITSGLSHSWQIEDDQQNVYSFGGMDGQVALEETVEKTMGVQYPSAWFIKSIVPFRCTNQPITFQYVENIQFTVKTYVESATRYVGPQTPAMITSAPGQQAESINQQRTAYLTKILWSGGEVTMQLSKSRPDNSLLYKLDQLTVYSKSGPIIQRCFFDYAPTGRLQLTTMGFGSRLDEIHEFTSEVIKPQRYVFEYNGMMPATTDSRDYDHWGHFNGPNGNFELIPSFVVNTPFGATTYSSSSNRSVNPIYAKKGILKKITYPTGGSTTFEFESNTQANYDMDQHLFSQPKDAKGDFYSGGLRIAKMTNNDPFHPTKNKVTAFSYDGDNNRSSGRIEELPIYAYYQDRIVVDMIQDVVLNQWFTKVTDDADFIAMRQTSLFNLGSRSANTYYSKVTVIHGINGEDGKEEYRYSTLLPQLSAAQMEIPFAATWYQDWKNLLISEAHYKRVGSADVKTEETSYDYQSIRSTENVKGIRVGAQVVVHDYVDGTFDHQNDDNHQYVAAEEMFVSDYTYLTHKTARVYDGQDPSNFMVVETFYEIDPVTLCNRSTRTISPMGQEEKITRTYTSDYTNSGPFNNLLTVGIMLAHDVFGLVVEEIKTIDNRVVGATLTSYDFSAPESSTVMKLDTRLSLGAHDMAEATIDRGNLVFDERYKPVIVYSHHDAKGNLLVQQPVDGPATAILWDYNNNLPVAEASIGKPDKNVEVTILRRPTGEIMGTEAVPNFAYTSFEGTNPGRWLNIQASQVVTDPNAPTGNKTYQLTATGLSYNFIRRTDYYLYVWKNGSGSLNVTSDGGTPTLELMTEGHGGWQLFRAVISNASTVSVSGTAMIDELRLFPTDAQLNTMTHIPGLGVQSRTDVNGRITYFSYDSYGRLQYVRDMQGNLVKSYDYQYQN
jgi:YD repeat-containing protein